MSYKIRYLVIVFSGLLAGVIIDRVWLSFVSTSIKSEEKKPIYWVAPMDPSYRRDQAGKSPMGMDLLPVYKSDLQGDPEGTVKISPAVVNNLGVRVESVKRSALNLDVNTVGYIAFDEKRLMHVHSRVDGWVEKLSLTAEGDFVEKGQKLFELYSPELVSAQEEYLSALLSESAVMSRASVSKLEALGVSKDQIQALRRTHKVKQRLNFYADKEGYVAELNVREGMFIKPATTIISIGSLDTVWVIAEVFERQAAWVEVGQAVEMKVGSYPGESWSGKVDYVYPVLNSQTRTVKARVSFPNKDYRLQPNMFVEMTLRGTSKADVLTIPLEAIIFDGDMSRVVKVLGDGRFLSTRVRIGMQSNGRVEVLDGLVDSDKVVISAQFLLDSESSISADLSRISSDQSPSDAHKEMSHD